MATPTQGSLSGNTYIDGVLWDGWRWDDAGLTTDITYFFDNAYGYGWSATEQATFRAAAQTWMNVANLSITQVFSETAADWVENITFSSTFSGRHEPPADASGTGQAEGTYSNYGFTPATLAPGGRSFGTFAHELGHALGLSHPHDAIGSAPGFPGVSVYTDLGTNSLNHSLFTTMSYNEDYTFDPNGNLVLESGLGNSVGLEYGYTATPMAFDIAAIQYLYGANMSYRTGNDTYVMTDSNGPGARWECIWDAGGLDTIVYDGSQDVIINLNAATLDGSSTSGGYLSYASSTFGGFTIAHGVVIESAVGGSGNDNLIANNAGNTLYANEGDDTLVGGTGADFLYGGSGADFMAGGNGNDQYDADDVGDEVVEIAGWGTDRVRSLISYVLPEHVENLTLMGTANIDGTGNVAANVIYGNAGNNRLSGGGGNDSLGGYGGDDVVYGGTGADTMFGGIGNDTYHVGDLGDQIIEHAGEGTDTIVSDINAYTLGANLEHLFVRLHGDGNALANDIHGNVLANTLRGHGGGDRLYGYANDDLLEGGDGDDLLDGGENDDILVGGAGSDTASYASAIQSVSVNLLTGQASGVDVGTDQLFGIENTIAGNANDSLTGDGTGNTLSGNDGNDTLEGGGGDDTLIGGEGFDTAVLSGAQSSYRIEMSLDGQYRSIDRRDGSPDGTDLLYGVERLSFNGDAVDVQSARFNALYHMPGWHSLAGDFNGDGADDLLWNSGSETGVLGTWLMDDGAIQQTIALNHDMPGWHALAGDFNGDGTDDLLWNSGTESGVLGTWLMGGGAIQQTIALNHDMPGWHALSGDFNGDGTDDLLWNSGTETGILGTWLMDGGGIGATIALNHDMPGWHALVGDFNGDGTDDLLWNSGRESGVLGVWLMDGGGIGATIALNHDMPGWDVAAVGDFNNDGTDDLLWRHEQGASGAWLMRDGFIFATFDTGSTAGQDAIAQGDFDDNGTTDILWQEAGGDVSTWMLA